MSARDPATSNVRAAVLVSALGYFVDVYDLVIYSVVRHDSLVALAVPLAQRVDVGVRVLNCELVGMILGGLAWGVLGDRRGRVSVLFASILIYSMASLATMWVASVPMYAVLRFIAGFGLAGELGAGTTLVSELLPARSRGWGTAIVASVGVLGAAAAALVTRALDWRWAYGVGGVLGLMLLGLRVGTLESALFARLRERKVARGELLAFVRRPRLFARLFALMLIGLPTGIFAALVVPFTREYGQALGLAQVAASGQAVVYGALGFSLGDLMSSALSQLLGSRRKVLFLYVLLFATLAAALLTVGGRGAAIFYGLFGAIGFARGYFAVLATTTCEQFGTNLRVTAATTTPALARALVVLVSLLFQALRAALGIRWAGAVVLAMSTALALLAIALVDETFGRDLEFTED